MQLRSLQSAPRHHSREISLSRQEIDVFQEAPRELVKASHEEGHQSTRIPLFGWSSMKITSPAGGARTLWRLAGVPVHFIVAERGGTVTQIAVHPSAQNRKRRFTRGAIVFELIASQSAREADVTGEITSWTTSGFSRAARGNDDRLRSQRRFRDLAHSSDLASAARRASIS